SPRCKLAQKLAQHGKLDEARAQYQSAIRLDPREALAHNNLGEIRLKQGRVALAKGCFEAALKIQPNEKVVQSNWLFCQNLDPKKTPEEIFEEHCRWGRFHETAVSPMALSNSPDPERRIRVGYLSPDLRYHAVMRYLEPVLANNDRDKFQVACYSQVAKPDAV